MQRAGNNFNSLTSEHGEWLRDKKINLLAQVGHERDPDFSSVPLLTAPLLPFVDHDQSSPALAPGTPEQIAAGEHFGAYFGPADQAGHAGAPVDIDLTAMIILTWRPAHCLGGVLRAYGVDPFVCDAVRHELDQIGPDPRPAPPAQLVAWAMRIDPVTEQDLCPVHVSDAGKDGLVHQKCRDRPRCTVDPAPCKIRIGVRTQRVGAERGHLRGNLGPRPQHEELGAT